MNTKSATAIVVLFTAFLLISQLPCIARTPSTQPASYSHEGNVGGRQEIERAIAQTEGALNAQPKSATLWLDLGRQYEALAEASGNRDDLEKAATAFETAGELGAAQGRIVGTYELADVLVRLEDRERLDEVFEKLMQGQGDHKGRYLAVVDYARALVRFDDDRAADYFEKAIQMGGADSVAAYNSYADWLVQKGRKKEAFDLLNRMPAALRERFHDPAVLRNRLIDDLGLTAHRDALRRRGAAGVALPGSGVLEDTAKFTHTDAGDDCRNPGNPPTCLTYNGTCYYKFLINLAEVLWNEARSENFGAISMVGWTVRDRAYETPTCDSYVGGASSSCRFSMPCSQLGFCDLSQRYCCVLHGATFGVGNPQSQFNDAHVQLSSLGDFGLLNEAYMVINGIVPEVSTNFVPGGVSGCAFGCSAPGCTSGFNYTTPSPAGPMEYLAFPYTAARASCKVRKGEVCGNATPNNYFWNRLP